MSETHYDVVIVGAGIAGCATARALALASRAGERRILVLDRYKDVHPRFSGEFIHPRGAQVLDDLGLFLPLRSAGAVEVDGFVVFESPDERRVDLPYAALVGQRPRGLSVHHKVLVRALRAQLREHAQVELREGFVVEALIRDAHMRIVGVEACDADGARHRFSSDLVIAADGKGSSVRKLAGYPDTRETIGFTLGVEVEDAVLPEPTYAHVFLGAWGPILAYPILDREDGRRIVRVTFDLPRELPHKGAELANYVLRAYIPFMPLPLATQTAAAIQRLHGRLEIAPTVNLPAPRAIQRGLALVGDAAGCSHPVTASGMTMGLRDAEIFGQEAARRQHVDMHDVWLDDGCLQRYANEHDRYVPTRQALADAIYEAFRGENEGARAIRRALFEYWASGETARRRSMALLSCVERRASVFLSEYLRTARHAVSASLIPRHASAYPWSDRWRHTKGALELAKSKLGLVSQVMWAQVRPNWLPRGET